MRRALPTAPRTMATDLEIPQHDLAHLRQTLPPPPRYMIQMRVHDRYCSAQSRGAKQNSKLFNDMS